MSSSTDQAPWVTAARFEASFGPAAANGACGETAGGPAGGTAYVATTTPVLRGDTSATITAAARPELRDGSWTRLGESAVLGDLVTEQVLAGLAESTRQAARAQGYLVGWSEGRREAAAEAAVTAAETEHALLLAEEAREHEHGAACQALARAGAALQAAVGQVSADVEAQALRLARELTELLVGHELRTSPDPDGDVVRRALGALGDLNPHGTTDPAGALVTLRVHPATAASVAAAALPSHGIAVLADPQLDRHDAVAETHAQLVDLRVGTALERVAEALS